MNLGKIVLSVLLICLFYAAGCLFPIVRFHWYIKHEPITTSVYYGLIVQFLGFVATLLAVLVALFKSDLLALVKKADLDVQAPDIEECFVTLDEDNQPLSASKYTADVAVVNTGNLPAYDCELFFDKVGFKKDGLEQYNDLGVVINKICWLNFEASSTSIHQSLKKKFRVFEICSPTTDSVPKEKGANQTPSINLCGHPLVFEPASGCYSAHFTLVSRHTKPVRFALELSWDGKWHNRKTEMKLSSKVSQDNRRK